MMHANLPVLLVAMVFLPHVFCALVMDRKTFLAHSGSMSTIWISTTNLDRDVTCSISSQLDAKNVPWSTRSLESQSPQWNQLRYGSSTLSSASSRAPTPSLSAAIFPSWMSGNWLTTYRISSVSFPQGRDKVTLRIAGAGIGTCLSIPNVGRNPAPFVQRFLSLAADADEEGSYEDVAYNCPRRFEAFWTQAKVTSVQIGNKKSNTNTDANTFLSPVCYVTGEGCTSLENPLLHAPTTRLVMDFDGPTRRGVSSQTIDATMVDMNTQHTSTMSDNNYISSRNYVQYNVKQELQTFYKEIVSVTKVDDTIVKGQLRVAAFLPDPGDHDDAQAVALYDYALNFRRLDEDGAASL
jgi:hypothetical protein